MTRTNEPSTYERPEWPLNAIPKRWIEALFAKMSAFYGSKFAAMWHGSKPDEVQKAWAIELGKLSTEQLKAGSNALTAFPKPPTLPEFVSHCRQVRAEMSARSTPQLENLTPSDPEKAAAAMRSVREASARLLRKEPTVEWAFKLLMLGTHKDGRPLTFEGIRCASDAISSSAGRRVVDSCADPDLRETYSTIRDAVIEDYRAKGKLLWEVR